MATLRSDNTNVVFIDTNLDTHLALVVSDHDTVSDFKERIVSEHPSCFPEIGHIHIHGIKVKRKGCFYHLSDSMFVRNAFSGFNKSWFLSVEASPVAECRQSKQLVSHASPNQVACHGIPNNALVVVDNAVTSAPKRVSGLDTLQLPQLENKQDEGVEIHNVSPSVSEQTDRGAVKNLETGEKTSGDNDDNGIREHGLIPETEDRCLVNHEVSSLHVECEVDGSGKDINDVCNVREEDPEKSVPSAMTKRKSKRKREEPVLGDNSKDNIATVDNPLSRPSKRASSKNNLQVPLLEKKQDENEEIPLDGKVVKDLGMDVKSSGNLDHGIPFTSSLPETRDNSCDNHELPNSLIECAVDGSDEGIKDDSIVPEEGTCKTAPPTKKKRKSKRNKEDTVQGDNSKDNIASVDNALSSPSKRASSLKKSHVPQLENKQDEKEEIPFVGPSILDHAEKVVKNSEMDVKSSDNSDHGIPFTRSLPESQDNCCLNHELPNSHIECDDDGSNKGIKVDYIVSEEGTSKPAPASKKKLKSKRKMEYTVQDGTSKENDASVVRPVDYTVHQDIVVLANPSVNTEKDQETEGLKERQHTEWNYNSTKNDLDAVSIKEASEPGPAANKKRKKRKRSLTHDSQKMLKVETAAQNDEAQKFDEAHDERKKSMDQFELNNDKSRDDVERKNSKLTEDILDTPPYSKKKQKGKRKSGEKNLSNAELINDFNVDSAAHHFLEDGQNIKTSSADQSAERFKGADPLRTSVQGRRSKGSINSSNFDETPVVNSSRSDGEADQSLIKRGVQDEISEDCLLSKDISMRKTTLDNMEIRTDACKESTQSTVKRTLNCENHCYIERRSQPSDLNEPKELAEHDENAVRGHCHKSEAGQTERAEEGRVLSIENGPNLEKCTLLKQDNTNANIKELNVSSKVMDVSGMNDPVKSEKKKKRTTKAKNSGRELAHKEGKVFVDASKSETDVHSLKATNCDPMSRNSVIEKNPLNQSGEGENGQEDMHQIVLSVTGKEDDFSMDSAGSLEQIKTKSNAEHLDERVDKSQRKKSKNKQTCTAKSISNLPTKDQFVDSQKECDVSRIHPDKKVGKVQMTEQDAKLSNRSDSAMSSIEGNRKPRKNASGKSMDLEKRREHLPISNSKLESSNKMVKTEAGKAGKACGNNVGGVVSNTQQRKSLLAGAIFKDDSSCTSQDGVDNSDVSTRTPSDNSLLSDFSDLDSQHGTYGGERMENGGRSSLKESFSGSKGMPIDLLLKSSSRYKKAKITASQLDETESQPEFVPDSLAEI